MAFRFFLDNDKTVNVPAIVTKEDGVTVVCQFVQEEKRWKKCKRVMSEGTGESGSTYNEVMEGDFEANGLPQFPYADGAFEDAKPVVSKETPKVNDDFKKLVEAAIVQKLSQLTIEQLMELRGK